MLPASLYSADRTRIAMAPSWQRPEVTLAPAQCASAADEDDLRLAAECGVRAAAARDTTCWQLVRSGGELELCSPAAIGGMRLRLDVRSGPLGRRLRGARRSDSLGRAIGLPRRQAPPRVVDATAGLCRDAMVLASLGCEVLAIERVPALAMLARNAAAAAGLQERLRIEVGDSVARLRECLASCAPDVVYLDPMFDEAGSAQVKKDMQICRLLAAPAADAPELLAAARAAAVERVVVKRHPDQAPLGDGVSFSVGGERVRFDVYLAGSVTPGRQRPAP
jgi:16S rRNA (guanine1516-N2)-methyltransferase